MTYFSGSKFVGCFEKHPKVVSGALRDVFRAREVFGSFEKRTPGQEQDTHNAGAELGEGCRGCAPLPESDLRLSNTTGILQKSVIYRCL